MSMLESVMAAGPSPLSHEPVDSAVPPPGQMSHPVLPTMGFGPQLLKVISNMGRKLFDDPISPLHHFLRAHALSCVGLTQIWFYW